MLRCQAEFVAEDLRSALRVREPGRLRSDATQLIDDSGELPLHSL